MQDLISRARDILSPYGLDLSHKGDWYIEDRKDLRNEGGSFSYPVIHSAATPKSLLQEVAAYLETQLDIWPDWAPRIEACNEAAALWRPEHLGACVTVDAIVSRHAGLVAYLREDLGIDAPVLDHAGPDEVRGKRIIGILPMRLAALCESYIEASLNIPLELRGQELTLEQVRDLKPQITRYRVAAEKL